MTKVEGHIIGAPLVKAKASGASLNNIQVVKGVRIEKWAFVIFKSSACEMLNEDEEDIRDCSKDWMQEFRDRLEGAFCQM